MTDSPQQHAEADAALEVAVSGSQPERLAVVARLRGLDAADAGTARVLEIGCATGRNLLPLAEREPAATFVGLERHAANVRQAAALADRAGLSNVQFIQWDLDATEEQAENQLGEFDYILVNGLYAWVDSPRRDKLLAVCQRQLAPHGVACCSYNTLPGWHVHQMFADMMRYDARDATTPAEAVSRARGLLEFLRASLVENGPYDALVQSELTWVLSQSDGYLRHEYLNEASRATYFGNFVAHAADHSLQPLSDLAAGLAAEDRMTAAIEQPLSELAVGLVAREQLRDVLRNRTVRQTLVCHAAVSLSNEPASSVLDRLWLESQLRPETTDVSPTSFGLARYVSPDGRRLATSVPLIKTALVRLGAAWPNLVSTTELAESAEADLLAVSGTPAEVSAADRERLRDNLLHAALGGMVELHSRPQQFTAAISDRPCASGTARLQAERGNVVVNRKHQNVRLGDFDHHVLQLLDGSRDQAKLLDDLTAWIASGRLTVQEHGQPVHDPARARQLLAAVLPETLTNLARAALLVA